MLNISERHLSLNLTDRKYKFSHNKLLIKIRSQLKLINRLDHQPLTQILINCPLTVLLKDHIHLIQLMVNKRIKLKTICKNISTTQRTDKYWRDP